MGRRASSQLRLPYRSSWPTQTFYIRIGSRLAVSSATQNFLSGLGSDLEKMNLNAVSAIQAGSPSGPDLDARMVHMEQTKVQGSLDALRNSDSAGYNQVIKDSNDALN